MRIALIAAAAAVMSGSITSGTCPGDLSCPVEPIVLMCCQLPMEMVLYGILKQWLLSGAKFLCIDKATAEQIRAAPAVVCAHQEGRPIEAHAFMRSANALASSKVLVHVTDESPSSSKMCGMAFLTSGSTMYVACLINSYLILALAHLDLSLQKI